MTYEIDEKLFAHIFNDAFLIGSYKLQGNKSSTTINYLNNFIQNEYNTVPDNINKTTQQFKKLVAYEDLVCNCKLDEVSTTITNDIKNLKPNDMLFIPGGWASHDGGHSMIYQASLDENGDLIFSIHNSGSGLRFHEKRLLKGKELYNPVLTYKIPKSQIQNKELTSIIEKLMSCQILETAKQKIDCTYLYKEVFPLFAYVDGKQVKSNSPNQEKWFTSGQISGTCTQKSLHQMLKKNFESPEEYRLFIYKFKMYALKQYMEQIKSTKTIQNPQIHHQVNIAIIHAIRILLSLHEDKKIEQTQLQTDLNLLNGYLKDIQQNIPEKQQTPTPIATVQPVTWNNVMATFIISHTTDKKSQKLAANTQEQTYEAIKINFSSNDDILTTMSKLSQPDETVSSYLILEKLEEFFLNAPIPTDYNDELSSCYKGINKENIQEFYTQMLKLQKIYFSHFQKIAPDTTLPRMYAVKMSAQTILNHVTNKVDGFRYHNTQNIFDHIIQNKTIDSIYLANNNLTIDNRFKSILQLNESQRQQDMKEYYNNIISEHPDAKKYLQKQYTETYSDQKNYLHRYVKENQLTALFCLLKNYNDYENNKKLPVYVKKLVNIFSQQIDLERAFYYMNDKLFSTNGYTFLKDITLDVIDENKNLDFAIESYTQPYSINLCEYKPTKNLKSQKYSKKLNSVPSSNLSDYKLQSSNEVQLLPHKPSDKDIKERIQCLVRKDIDSQIILTIEYFQQNLDQMQNDDTKDFVESILFQPGLLEDFLKKDQNVKKFDDFIENGLFLSEHNNLLTQNSIIFIRLSSMANQFALKIDNGIFKERMVKHLETLEKLLNKTTDKAIKASLYQYYFLSAMQLQEQQELPLAIKQSLLKAFFYIQSNQNSHEILDVDSKIKLQFAIENVKRNASTYFKGIDKDFYIEVLKSLGMNLNAECNIKEKHPEYIVQYQGSKYTINLNKGLVYNQYNLSLCHMPSNIQGHPICSNLNPLTTMTFQDIYGNFIIEQPEPKVALRFIKEGNQYHVQKQFSNSNNKLEWYQLFPFSSSQKQHLNLADFSARLNGILQEENTLTWSNRSGNIIITDGDTIRYRKHNNKIIDIIDNSILSEYEQKTIFSHIEDPKFTVVFQKDNKYITKLPRYGLEFTTNQDNSTYFKWGGVEYKLNQDDLLKPSVGHLSFSTAAEGNKKSICLLPVQRYLTTSQQAKDSEYYEFRLDTDAQIKKNILNKDNKSQQAVLWQHSNTESFLALPIKDGSPVPNTPAEALYLAYIYLGSNQADKAWDTISYCKKHLGGMSGTEEELKYLNWIINDLPHLLQDGDKNTASRAKENLAEKKSTLLTPAVVACKLKALSLLTTLCEADKAIALSQPKKVENHATNRVNQLEFTKTQEFYKNFHDEIYTLFRKLQPMRRHMPEHFNLNDAECKSLLNVYYSKLPKEKALGALGYEYSRLKLKNIIKELRLLEAQKEPLTDFDNKRKEELASFIKDYTAVSAVSSEIEYVELNLDLPDIDYHDLTIRGNLLNLFNPTNLTIQNDCDKKLADLTQDITNELFIENYASYLHIISNGNDTDPQFKKLLSFCQNTISAKRHATDQTIVSLCKVLYILMHQEAPRDNIQSILKSIGQTGDALTFYYQFKTNDKYKKYPSPPPIKIPQYVDKTEAISEESKLILSKIPEEKFELITASIENSSLQIAAIKSTKSDWNDEINKAYTSKALITDSDIFQSNEYLIGEEKYKTRAQLIKIANRAFNKDNIAALQIELTTTQTTLTDQKAPLLQNILKLANQGPDDAFKQLLWQSEFTADIRPKLDINQLLTLYFHQDKVKYRNETRLSDDKIADLHNLLAQFLQNGLQLQQIERSQKHIKDLEKAVDNEKEQIRYELVACLFAKNIIGISTDPALTVFQYHSDKLLRQEQKESIERLLKSKKNGDFEDVIEKVIMGGGKSKVLLPTVAQKKATGTNLVIIEVPRSLLRTNFVDLSEQSETFYHQSSQLFEFNRDSNCSSQRLEEIYTQFTDMMVEKGYIVTTGDSLQSLELKYFELLDCKPDSPAQLQEWEKQVDYANKILTLIKNRGDLIIDEVHQGLLLKNKLNYPTGIAAPITKSVIENSIEMYDFLSSVKINKKLTLNQVIRHNKLLVLDSEFKDACAKIADELIVNDNSPIKDILEKCNKYKIKNYLLGKESTIPEWVKELAPLQREKLLFYQIQINHILPRTLSRNFKENYGPSIANSDPILQSIAIPYVANDTPSERSQFGNYLETMNYTIQSMLIDGISKPLLKENLNNWQTQALSNARFNKDKTNMEIVFNEYLKENKITLDRINLDDDAEFNMIYQELYQNPAFIKEILSQDICTKITYNTDVLTHNAYNHVDMVRSCQGVTGTPSNHDTYHHNLIFDKNTALGTDGYILSGIKAKAPKITYLDFKNDVSGFINKLFADYQSGDRVRAIIDISASIKTQSTNDMVIKYGANFVVAKEIANYIRMNHEKFNQPKPIQHVLFFDKNNELSALSVKDESSEPKIIPIRNTDVDNINERLGGSTPEERFTYYDNYHITGTDIKQERQAKSLVLIDHNTSLDNFLQGSMRMRGLIDGKQSIDLKCSSTPQGKDFDTIISEIDKKDKLLRQNNNFEGILSQMQNVVREALKQEILTKDANASEKSRLFKIYHKHFKQIEKKDFWDKFSEPANLQKIEDILNSTKTSLLSNWKEISECTDQDIHNALQKKMDALIETALSGICPEQYKTTGVTLDNSVEVQKQQQKEVAVEIEQELQDVFDKSDQEQPFINPTNNSCQYKTLSEICQPLGSKDIPDFSQNITASQNFYMNYLSQTSFLDMTAKPVLTLLFSFNQKNKLICNILSQDELQYYRNNPETLTKKKAWIGTTQHSVVIGQPPADILKNQDYHTIIEQIRYFNGELNLLIADLAPHNWIYKDTMQKIYFFKNHLKGPRAISQATITKLEKKLDEKNTIYEDIFNEKLQLNFDWKSLPDIDEGKIKYYKDIVLYATLLRENLDQLDNCDIMPYLPFNALSDCISYTDNNKNTFKQQNQYSSNITKDFLLNITKNNKTSDKVLFILSRYKACDNDVILAIMNHPKCNNNVLSQLLPKLDTLSNEILTKIINEVDNKNSFSTITTHVLKKNPQTPQNEQLIKEIIKIPKIGYILPNLLQNEDANIFNEQNVLDMIDNTNDLKNLTNLTTAILSQKQLQSENIIMQLIKHSTDTYKKINLQILQTTGNHNLYNDRVNCKKNLHEVLSHATQPVQEKIIQFLLNEKIPTHDFKEITSKVNKETVTYALYQKICAEGPDYLKTLKDDYQTNELYKTPGEIYKNKLLFADRLINIQNELLYHEKSNLELFEIFTTQCSELQTAADVFFKYPDQHNFEKFEKKCARIMNDIDIELNKHRGFGKKDINKRRLIGLLSLFLVFPAIIIQVASTQGFYTTCFKTEVTTKSSKKFNFFKEEIKNLSTEIQKIHHEINPKR